MTQIIYKNSSVYSLTPQNSWSLGIWTPRSIPALDSDVMLKVNAIYNHKPHLLAYDLYNDPNLWWVFAVRNPDKFLDPVYDLVPDMEIMITDASALQSLLNV